MQTASEPEGAHQYVYSGKLSVPVGIRPFFPDRITLAILNMTVGEHEELHRRPLIGL